MRRMILAGALALVVSTFTLIAAPVAGATTYNNDTPIIIPAQGVANPYPSSITVSGTAGPITDVNVGLDGLTHARTNDVLIVLVAPSGQGLMLQGCAGSSGTAAGAFLTFDETAAGRLPDDGGLTTGTFKPTNRCAATPAFPAGGPLTYGNPGPVPAGTATLADFNGLSAIGTWKLFVVDGRDEGSGSIPGGWSLDVNPNVTPPATPAPPPGITCGTGTVLSGSQCVVNQIKKKKKKKKKRKKR